jgi:hypothetical protein
MGCRITICTWHWYISDTLKPEWFVLDWNEEMKRIVLYYNCAIDEGNVGRCNEEETTMSPTHRS